MEFKRSKTKKQTTKQNKNKLIDTENRLVVTIGERAGDWAKWVKGVNCMVMGSY